MFKRLRAQERGDHAKLVASVGEPSESSPPSAENVEADLLEAPRWFPGAPPGLAGEGLYLFAAVIGQRLCSHPGQVGDQSGQGAVSLKPLAADLPLQLQEEVPRVVPGEIAGACQYAEPRRAISLQGQKAEQPELGVEGAAPGRGRFMDHLLHQGVELVRLVRNPEPSTLRKDGQAAGHPAQALHQADRVIKRRLPHPKPGQMEGQRQQGHQVQGIGSRHPQVEDHSRGRDQGIGQGRPFIEGDHLQSPPRRSSSKVPTVPQR